MEKASKENKKKIMEMIEKAGDPKNYETSWDEGGVVLKSKKKSNIKRGKKIKGQSGRFELNVRKDLESKGNVVDKWNNNVDLELGRLIIAKKKFNPFSKVMMMGSGFPDFVSIKHIHEESYSVVGVEAKMNGILSKIEKEKCAWYLKNKIFSKIWIAKKGEKRGEIEYIDFEERFGKKFL